MGAPATAAVRLLSGEREPVRVATTSFVPLQGLPVIDGVALEVNDRVLVKDQIDARENGIYTASTGRWYRASDASFPRAIGEGITVQSQEGVVNAGKAWRFAKTVGRIGAEPIQVSFYLSASFSADAENTIGALKTDFNNFTDTKSATAKADVSGFVDSKVTAGKTEISATAQQVIQPLVDQTKTARDIAAGYASDANASKQVAGSSATQAQLSALAAGAPVYTTFPSPLPAPLPDGRRVFQLQTPAGIQVYTHDGTTATMVGWQGKVEFKTVSDLVGFSGPLGPQTTRFSAQGLEFEVLPVAQPARTITQGGVKLRPVRPEFSNFLPSFETIPLVTVNRVIGVVGNYLIGTSSGGTLHRSRDGVTWTAIKNPGFALNGAQARMVEMDDGEVLLTSSDGRALYRSEGWAANPATAVFNQVLVAGTYGANTAYFDRGWGWRVHGKYVYVSEYGNPKPNAHRSYFSQDYGKTFVVVFDARNLLTIPAGGNCHNHGGTIDIYHKPNPRLWQFVGDSGFVSAWYSDDFGGAWTRLDGIQFPTITSVAKGVEPCNYLSIDVTPSGMIIGTDDWPNGTAVIPRDANYAASPRIQTAHSFNDDLRTSHLVQAVETLGDWAFSLMRPVDGFALPPRIVATHSKSARGWSVFIGPVAMDVNRIFLLNETLWVGATLGGTLYKIPLYQTKDVLVDQGAVIDPGGVLGGKKRSDDRALAVGSTAEASGSASLAVGPLTKLAETQQLAVALFAKLTGDRAYAFTTGAQFVGTTLDPTGSVPSADVNGVRAGAIGAGPITVTGASALVVGDRGKANGARAIAIGAQPDATGTAAIVIGFGKTSANFAIAIGDGSEASGASSIALGQGSKATATNALSLGAGTAGHSSAIAFPGANTEAIQQVAWGQRYDLHQAFTTNRPASATSGAVVSWWHQLGDGTFELRFRQPDGSIRKLSHVAA